MVLSTKGRYSLRLMLNVALHPPGQPVPLRQISQEEDISLKYLEQLAHALTKANLLRAERGFCGGYLLAKPAETCTVGEIVRAVEGDMAPADCVHSDCQCERSPSCVTQEVWREMAQAIDQVLDRWTLANLVQRYHDKSERQETL